MKTVDNCLNICVFTGTRAEYGLLRPLLRRINVSRLTKLNLLVSGSHLSSGSGYTVNEIIADGFIDYERAEILVDGGTNTSVYTAMGLGLIRYGDYLSRLKPDVAVILGDRYESLAFASAATICRVPIAHIHGGEKTMGAMDDVMRHAITKMSHLHFTATQAYRKRVIQLGENPKNVFNVGALGVENVHSVAKKLSRKQVELKLGLASKQAFFLITYHPVTLEHQDPQEQIRHFLNTLMEFKDHVLVFTGANADQGGTLINRFIKEMAKAFPDRIRYFDSLGVQYFLSSARFADCVIGNSSSGVIEIPSLGVPVVNIGTRQDGRVSSTSVIHCHEEQDAIRKAVKKALSESFINLAKSAKNPYEGSNTSASIFKTLVALGKEPISLKKNFYDI